MRVKSELIAVLRIIKIFPEYYTILFMFAEIIIKEKGYKTFKEFYEYVANIIQPNNKTDWDKLTGKIKRQHLRFRRKNNL